MKRTAGSRVKSWYEASERLIFPQWVLAPENARYRRRATIGYFSALFAIVMLLLYAVLVLWQQRAAVALVDFSTAVALMGVLAYFRTTKGPDNYALEAGLTIYGCFCICMCFAGTVESPAYLWVFTFPVAALFLMSSPRGTVTVALFLSTLTLLLIFDQYIPYAIHFSWSVKMRLMISLFSVSVLSYLFERSLETVNRRLNLVLIELARTNEEIEQQVEERTADLQRSQEKYRFLTERMSDIVWTIDVDMNLTYASPSISKMLGVPPEETKAHHLFELATPESFAMAKRVLAQEVAQDKDEGVDPYRTRVLEMEFKRRDGSTVWLENVVSAIRNEEGRFIGVHGVSRDITDRKQTELMLRRQSDQLRELSAKLAETEETERRRISRELHDKVGQNLATLGLNLNILQSVAPVDAPGEIPNRIKESLALLEQTTEVIRDVMADLRPPVIDDYGLVTAIRWYGNRFSRRTGIEFYFHGEDLSPRPKASIEIALFRIFQEALLNVSKHAQARKVEVTEEMDGGHLKITIIDDGMGFDLNTAQDIDKRYGWGLKTMNERAESVGGKFSIESRRGQGTKITIEVAL